MMNLFTLGGVAMSENLDPIDASPAKACRAYVTQYRVIRLGYDPFVRATVPKPKKFRGVDKHTDFNRLKFRWVARIKVYGKTIYLGDYVDPIEAAKAYDAAAKKLGRTTLNFP